MQGLVSGRSAAALLVHRVQDKVIEKLGGKAAAHVVLILALVFALDTADKGAVGAMAKQLESTFDMSKAQLGTLATASGAVGAIAAIFFGWLVDRSRRTRVLAIAIVLWAGAMAASAGAVSYMYLLYTRLAIGALTAAAVPAVASLVGDYFPPAHRGKMYSYILAGEVIGAAFGLFIAGELALLSWRAGFLSIALPALGVAWLVERLPEPPRDGRGRIREGQERVDAWSSPEEVRESDQEQDRSTQILRSMARERQIEPREELISSEDPKDKSLWWAIGYVLRIPTNLLLIIASALGYYFFAGIRLFGLEYVNGQFGFSHSGGIGIFALVGVGALCGVLAGGRIGDLLIKRGYLTGRILVVTTAYFAACLLFFPAFWFTHLSIALPFLVLAGFAFLSIFPSLGAARLDIMHGHLWGRAEAVRMAFRKAGEAVAPVVFGQLAGVFGGGIPGLQKTFLIMLIPLFASGIIAFVALRTYPRDAATADAFVRSTKEQAAESSKGSH